MALITSSRHGGVAVIRLERQERRNALTPAICGEVVAAIRKAESDPGVGALLIEAAGPAFCSGGDIDLLEQAAADPVDQDMFEQLGAIYDLFVVLQRSRVPSVAAVGGDVVGAGVNLALSCDIRIVADDLRLRGFAGSGIHPGGGHISMMLQQLGPQAAAAVALFDEPLNATAALRCGFAWRVVSREQLGIEAHATAERAARDPELTRITVNTFRAARAARLDQEGAVQLERAAQLWSLRRWSKRRASR